MKKWKRRSPYAYRCSCGKLRGEDKEGYVCDACGDPCLPVAKKIIGLDGLARRRRSGGALDFFWD